MKTGENGTIYHIAIAVNNLKESERLYKKVIGLKVTHRETVEDQGVKAVMLMPESKQGTAIELLEPLNSDSPISKFIEKKGEGIHHICFFVDNLESSLKVLKDEGMKLIDEKPRIGADNMKVAFVHPKSFNGVLIELAEIKKG
ncbi:MAG: methylmalonyl-CoA epimerase [Thermodesulfobacteriota bacterium]